MIVSLEKLTSNVETALRVCDLNFDRIVAAFAGNTPQIRDFVDATAAAKVRYLPDGNSPQIKDYYYVKTDAGPNTVTIYPFGTQTIVGLSSITLVAQYDYLQICFDRSAQTWFQK